MDSKEGKKHFLSFDLGQLKKDELRRKYGELNFDTEYDFSTKGDT